MGFHFPIKLVRHFSRALFTALSTAFVYSSGFIPSALTISRHVISIGKSCIYPKHIWCTRNKSSHCVIIILANKTTGGFKGIAMLNVSLQCALASQHHRQKTKHTVFCCSFIFLCSESLIPRLYCPVVRPQYHGPKDLFFYMKHMRKPRRARPLLLLHTILPCTILQIRHLQLQVRGHDRQ